MKARVSVVSTTQAARERAVEDAIHSGAMEGLTVSAAFDGDAADYSRLAIDIECAHVTALPEFLDPYLDPDMGILRNLVGATSKSVLDAREAELTAFRAVELAQRPARNYLLT